MAKLLDKYKKLLEPVSTGLSNIVDNAQKKLQQAELAKISYDRQRSNNDTRGQRIGQSFLNNTLDIINKTPERAQTAKNLSNTLGNITNNKYAQAPIQFTSGAIQAMNLGLGQSPAPIPISNSGKLANTVGSSVGAANPYGATGKIVRSVTKATNPYFNKLVGNIGGSIAPRIAGGLSNVAQGRVIDPLTNQQTTLDSQLFDFGTGLIAGPTQFDDALKPAAKGFDFGRNKQSTWHPEDVAELDAIKDFLRGKRKIDTAELRNADRTITSLAQGYLPVETINKLAGQYGKNQKGFLKAMVKELDKSAQRLGAYANEKDAFDISKITLGIADNKQIRRSDMQGDLLNQSNKKLKEMFGDSFSEPMQAVIKSKKTPQVSGEEIRQIADNAMINQEIDPGVFKKAFAKFIGKRDAAETTAAQVGTKFKNIGSDKFEEFVNQIEKTGVSKDPKIKASANVFRKEMDKLFTAAKKDGLDINYLKNYVTHFWDRPAKEVEQMYQALKTRGFFQNDRTIPTYAEGIQMGLKPKYNNVGQLAGEYTKRLEKIKANYELFKTLKDQGLIVDTISGVKNTDFKPIMAEGFPRSSIVGPDGKTVEGVFYAPTEIADTINRVFGIEDKNNITNVLEKTANLSKKIQEIKLSGGIPGTPVNAFSAANLVKEYTSGNVISPTKSALRSLSQNKSLKYFEDNAEQIKKMQMRNIPLSTEFNTKSFTSFKDQISQAFTSGGVKGAAGKAWDKVMSDATFKRFIPMLQIDMFNRIEKQAMKQGKSAEEAADIAAQAIKNFYGVVGSDKTAARSSLENNTLSTFLFAPKFREAMINFWGNNIKSLKNPTALENRQNLKFMAGTGMTIAAMQYLSQKLNGNGMEDNPEYKKDKLLIPAGDITIGIPILPSIGTVPRAIYAAGAETVKGNVDVAAKELSRRLLSAAITPIADVVANQDYFGREIADPNASASEKNKSRAGYLFKEYVAGHPWIKEFIDKKSKEDPVAVRLSRAAELPFRFYKTESIKTAPFWEEYNNAKSAKERLDSLKYQDPQKAVAYYQENKQLINSLPGMKDQVGAYYDSGKNSAYLAKGGVISNDQHFAFTGTDGKFHLIDTDFSLPELKLTGNELVDKKLKSSYTSDINAKQRNVMTLLENGVIDPKQAESILRQLENGRGVAKSPKKVKVPKIPPIKIPKAKISSSAPTKVKELKRRKSKQYRLNKVRKLTASS